MVERLSEGAEAIIYRARILGIDAVVKERTRKGYRVQGLDERIRASRTRKEAKITSLAMAAGVSVPRILLVDRYCICMSRVHGRNLNKMTDVSASTLDQLGLFAGIMHNAGITHGDYTPANVMIDQRGEPWVIDFGLSELSHSEEEAALDLLLMKRSIGEAQYKAFLIGYRRSCKNANGVIRRLAKIEKRGRYNTRTLFVLQDQSG